MFCISILIKKQPWEPLNVHIFFKICHLFTFNWNKLWLCFISPPSQSCPSFSVLGLSCPLRVFFSLSCYVSYCLFLSLWVLLHDSHFLLCRCSSFLAYINFPCMGYISLSFQSESKFTFPNVCSLFSSWHKSVNRYEPECLTKVSKNRTILGFFCLFIFNKICFDHFPSHFLKLQHPPLFYCIVLEAALTLRFTPLSYVLTLTDLKRKAFKMRFC